MIDQAAAQELINKTCNHIRPIPIGVSSNYIAWCRLCGSVLMHSGTVIFQPDLRFPVYEGTFRAMLDKELSTDE